MIKQKYVNYHVEIFKQLMSYSLVSQSRNILQHYFHKGVDVQLLYLCRVPQDDGMSLSIQVLLWLHKEVAYSYSRQTCLVVFSWCSRSFAMAITMAQQ